MTKNKIGAGLPEDSANKLRQIDSRSLVDAKHPHI